LYIEKYSIALLDPNGYSELVIHPPPFNFLIWAIFPCMCKKSIMRKAAGIHSK
jgi:hypothetical protein